MAPITVMLLSACMRWWPAFGLQAWIGSVNSVTAALASSLLATIVAAQMRQEHQEQHSRAGRAEPQRATR